MPALLVYIIFIAALTYLGILNIPPIYFGVALSHTWNYQTFWSMPDSAAGHWYFGRLWSLALEFQFYLLWVCLFICLPRSARLKLLLVLVLAMPVVCVMWYINFPEQRGALACFCTRRQISCCGVACWHCCSAPLRRG